ncbi:ArsR/SmtB family transcription factor [Bacillus sp. FJAT-45066]|uniref:ArsR/SmtB family transcription factor n=1 Tax=Bacillus sp. FJAT-45066 TaxID=2011010 RepID=UPI000BB85B62|nr:metalloregulator ArsR/SmtB family transcription factor [Bacillus sp. FJAT-45066]
MGQKALDILRTCIPTFQALSDPHRQDIILLLGEHKKLTVNDITGYSSLSRPAISHHLKILKSNALIKVEQQGTQRFYSLALEDSLTLLKQLIESVEKDCL